MCISSSCSTIHSSSFKTLKLFIQFNEFDCSLLFRRSSIKMKMCRRCCWTSFMLNTSTRGTRSAAWSESFSSDSSDCSQSWRTCSMFRSSIYSWGAMQQQSKTLNTFLTVVCSIGIASYSQYSEWLMVEKCTLRWNTECHSITDQPSLWLHCTLTQIIVKIVYCSTVVYCM